MIASWLCGAFVVAQASLELQRAFLVVVRGLPVTGLPCCGTWPLGPEGFGGRGSWVLEHSSLAVVPGLGCSLACGIFLDWASNLCLLHWQAGSLPAEPPGNPLSCLISNLSILSKLADGGSVSSDRTVFDWCLLNQRWVERNECGVICLLLCQIRAWFPHLFADLRAGTDWP